MRLLIECSVAIDGICVELAEVEEVAVVVVDDLALTRQRRMIANVEKFEDEEEAIEKDFLTKSWKIR